jgi:hypothetical protein
MQNISLKCQNNYPAFARYYRNADLIELQGLADFECLILNSSECHSLSARNMIAASSALLAYGPVPPTRTSEDGS